MLDMSSFKKSRRNIGFGSSSMMHMAYGHVLHPLVHIRVLRRWGHVVRGTPGAPEGERREASAILQNSSSSYQHSSNPTAFSSHAPVAPSSSSSTSSAFPHDVYLSIYAYLVSCWKLSCLLQLIQYSLHFIKYANHLTTATTYDRFTFEVSNDLAFTVRNRSALTEPASDSHAHSVVQPQSHLPAVRLQRDSDL